jgi:hypothetical protein
VRRRATRARDRAPAGRETHITDFVACVGCKAVFHLAAYAETGDAQLKSDAAYASGAYRKPGRR